MLEKLAKNKIESAVLNGDSPWCIPLSRLRTGNMAASAPKAEELARLRQMAKAFAGKCSEAQAELILYRFFEYFSLWERFAHCTPRYQGFVQGGKKQTDDGKSMLDYWTVAEPGKLRYLAREWIQSCDNGVGEGQELAFSHYCVVQLISEEELLQSHAMCDNYVDPEGLEYAKLNPGSKENCTELCWSWKYGGALKGDECPVFEKGGLYMYKPFGLEQCFLMYTYIL